MPPTHGRRPIVGDRVENLARVLQARIDDLDRGNDVFGGAQDLGKPRARALQRHTQNEGKLDLDPRPAIVLVRNFGAVRDHHVIEQVPVIRLVDLRGALHRLRGQADLVADQLRPGGHLAPGHFGGDGIGVLDGDVGPGLGELDRLLALLFRAHEYVGGFLAVGIGQHGSSHRADHQSSADSNRVAPILRLSLQGRQPANADWTRNEGFAATAPRSILPAPLSGSAATMSIKRGCE